MTIFSGHRMAFCSAVFAATFLVVGCSSEKKLAESEPLDPVQLAKEDVEHAKELVKEAQDKVKSAEEAEEKLEGQEKVIEAAVAEAKRLGVDDTALTAKLIGRWVRKDGVLEIHFKQADEYSVVVLGAKIGQGLDTDNPDLDDTPMRHVGRYRIKDGLMVADKSSIPVCSKNHGIYKITFADKEVTFEALEEQCDLRKGHLQSAWKRKSEL